MHLSWLNPDDVAVRDIAECVALLEDARLVDAPHQVGWLASAYGAELRFGWDGDPPEVALARTADGTAAAVLEVRLPRYDNTHLGFVMVTVDPRLRRRGIGRHLFDVGMQRVQAAGRTLVCSECLADGAGEPFLEAARLKRASVDVERRQELRDVDRAHLDAEYRRAQTAARGYEILRLPTPVPEHLVADVVQVTQAINDAPRDDLDFEDDVFSAHRVRAFETAQEAHGRRIYRVAARHAASGCLVGHTIVAVDAERPWYGSQYDTSVLSEHRGHRLGLLLKIAMLEWLAQDEPQLRVLDTWNSESNAHMIGVNEALGYRISARGYTWQMHL